MGFSHIHSLLTMKNEFYLEMFLEQCQVAEPAFLSGRAQFSIQ